MTWETVIGLEVHAQLATKSKIFSGASIAYGAEPNTQACAVDLGLPGVLPVLNKETVRMAVKFGLAIGAELNDHSIFARKNYFYPDLPKGYQISQFERPIVGLGYLDVLLEDGSTKRIGVTRAHLEEDAGKSLHEDFQGMSGIDLNRAGTPLLEIVSEPDMRSAKEAVAYLKVLHALVRYLEICDGNMQEGSFRCDANVSVRKKGAEKLGTRAELKNLNSFKFIERAINIEVERQIEVIESSGDVVQETRLYDSDRDETRSMRSKEEANDYRYFPDPDLLPVELEPALIEDIRSTLPELPAAKKQRFIDDYKLSADDAAILTSAREMADFYEAVLKGSGADAKLAANWVIVELVGALNKAQLEVTNSPVSSELLAGMLKRLQQGSITSKMAKETFVAMWEGEGTADEIIEVRGLKLADSSEVEAIIDKIIADNPAQVEQFRAGKDKVLGFFVGQIMKASRGKADPATVNKLLKDKLK